MIRDNSISDRVDGDAGTIALRCLIWVIGDDMRADRFLGLTGLDGDSLRQRVQEPAIHLAVMDYLMGYEPDLLACAEATGLPLTTLVATHRALSS